MEDLGKIHQLIIHILGQDLTFNLESMIMTWIVIISLLIFGYLAARKRNIIPNLVQVVGELIIGVFYDLTEDALGKELGKKYAPLICALFMFLFFCNWLGIFPHLEEPTKDLNTPLSYGLLGFVLAHHAGIKAKGLKTYLKDYCEPMFIMAPLNVIGELAKVISISFRLFGNIMGGSIIILVVSYLTFNLVTPPFLNAFFGAFVGTIQAFVFTMLTLVYIAVQVA
jgi:F-type H+-transporting ATPase subunit a